MEGGRLHRRQALLQRAGHGLETHAQVVVVAAAAIVDFEGKRAPVLEHAHVAPASSPELYVHFSEPWFTLFTRALAGPLIASDFPELH